MVSLSPDPLPLTPLPGTLLGTIVSYVFLGRTVRLEAQLKSGKLVTVALPKSEALSRDLNPGKSVILTIGSCQVFPANVEKQ